MAELHENNFVLSLVSLAIAQIYLLYSHAIEIYFRSINLSLSIIRTFYCLRYRHAVPFLRNDTRYYLLKTPKNTCCLGRGCSVLNALNLEKQGVKIHNCALFLGFLPLFWLYCTHALIF